METTDEPNSTASAHQEWPSCCYCWTTGPSAGSNRCYTSLLEEVRQPVWGRLIILDPFPLQGPSAGYWWGKSLIGEEGKQYQLKSLDEQHLWKWKDVLYFVWSCFCLLILHSSSYTVFAGTVPAFHPESFSGKFDLYLPSFRGDMRQLILTKNEGPIT